ncbi:uncharacterized protein FMAN_08680 [Fusarium mangiferae]|uniref:Uncharacterized protein n=1 Tax=Fusarium mangiferae TaxID=192010 RepID=A0A1L7T4I4_FUSMA|nr:uncharacterized protein FMAN_08680 [Fusarium mangiferae]CVK90211.1 uncharacterized protein FMAN_08680 [Fusarium mangiferae]
MSLGAGSWLGLVTSTPKSRNQTYPFIRNTTVVEISPVSACRCGSDIGHWTALIRSTCLRSCENPVVFSRCQKLRSVPFPPVWFQSADSDRLHFVNPVCSTPCSTSQETRTQGAAV